jgi:hypothetical protein
VARVAFLLRITRDAVVLEAELRHLILPEPLAAGETLGRVCPQRREDRPRFDLRVAVTLVHNRHGLQIHQLRHTALRARVQPVKDRHVTAIV